MFTLRPNTLVRADCFNDRVGLPALKDNAVDHLISDPPFAGHVHSVGLAGQYRANGRVTGSLGFAPFTEEDRLIFSEMAVRVTRGWIILFTDIESVGAWVQALTGAGAKRHPSGFWTKTNAAPKMAGNGASSPGEALVFAWAGEGRSEWNAGGCSAHYHYPTDRGNARRHETQKPLPLMRQLILDYTKVNDLILDPFAGGGATLIAAAQCHRQFLGLEVAATHSTSASFHRAQRALARVQPLSRTQMRMLHKERRASAYSGTRARQTAEERYLYDEVAPTSSKQPPRISGWTRG